LAILSLVSSVYALSPINPMMNYRAVVVNEILESSTKEKATVLRKEKNDIKQKVAVDSITKRVIVGLIKEELDSVVKSINLIWGMITLL